MLTEKEFGEMIQQIRLAFQKRDSAYPELLARMYAKVANEMLMSVGQTEQFLDLLKNEMKNSPVPLPPYLQAFLGGKVKLEGEDKLKYLILKLLACRPKTVKEKLHRAKLRWEIMRLRSKVQVDGVWKEIAEAV
jgi:hypothetical protein